MENLDPSILEDRIAPVANGGYHIALRVEFAFPAFERNTFPDDWVKRYTQQGFMLDDPVTRWVYEHSGAIRWSELEYPDPRHIMQSARDFGLLFGAAISVGAEGREGIRSYVRLARSDREFSEAELSSLHDVLASLHELTIRPCRLTEAELETLQYLASGLMMKEVAFNLGISESAVKQRLAGAKSKLSARTTTQAVMQANQLGWLK